MSALLLIALAPLVLSLASLWAPTVGPAGNLRLLILGVANLVAAVGSEIHGWTLVAILGAAWSAVLLRAWWRSRPPRPPRRRYPHQAGGGAS